MAAPLFQTQDLHGARHVLPTGRVVVSSGPEVAERLESEGDDAWR